MSTHMKSMARRLSPEQIPVFPLGGTVLLPGCELPLNIFEPRYLNMIDDMLKGDRVIGLIQPQYALDGAGAKTARPDLARIGTLGRLRQFSETDDGRYLISLAGLKRFTFIDEADVTTPYRQAQVSYDAFSADIDVHDKRIMPTSLEDNAAERARLTAGMKSFARSLGVDVDWGGLNAISMDRLVDQTAMISPFSAQDKQSLLEASSHAERRSLLIGLMKIYSQQATPPDKSDMQ
ncbi:LON peptidase substrate-binding domain-containing protein [Robiginitomaculum antarcticum]|uniref:LON peptidase substrate-binding domain-containing protein n=1 Tax=Robiginitomaculum antarcticum TaxID=437507 RepID=UPI000477B471|nr:LON peptidase substrate-binding domain-containing protein [Robiginitomaculum antarcticum]